MNPRKIGFLAYMASCSLMAYERGDTIVHLSFDETVDAVGSESGSTVIHSGAPAYADETPAADIGNGRIFFRKQRNSF